MAKKRTINELRQTKDTVYTNPGAKTKWDVEGHKKYLEEIKFIEVELKIIDENKIIESIL